MERAKGGQKITEKRKMSTGVKRKMSGDGDQCERRKVQKMYMQKTGQRLLGIKSRHGLEKELLTSYLGLPAV